MQYQYQSSWVEIGFIYLEVTLAEPITLRNIKQIHSKYVKVSEY